MANTAQARKRVRQAEKHRVANTSYRSMTRTYIKKTLKAIEGNDKTLASEHLIKAQSALDRSIKRGLVHKNTVARTISRLNSRIRAIA